MHAYGNFNQVSVNIETRYRDTGLNMDGRQHGRHEIYPGSGNHFSSGNVPSNYYLPGYVPQSLPSTESNRPPVNMQMTQKDRGLGQTRVGPVEDFHDSILPYGQRRNQSDHNQEQEDEDKPSKLRNVPSNYYLPGYVPQSLPSTESNRPPGNMQMTHRERGLGQTRVGPVEDFHESILPYGQRNQIDHNQEQEEPPKPRNVWWYTGCRVFSAILIILDLTFDWIEYTDMEDPIEDDSNCQKQEFDSEDVANQFLYVCIAGTILAILQMVNIVYQIVQNHRLHPTEEIPNHLDERTEVFLVTTFIEIPQNFLLFRYEKLLCLDCEVEWDSKTIKRFMNGLVACLSSIWRYITNIKVSAGDKSDGCCRNPCQKCGDCFGNCIKKFCNGLLKCLCPCCCCCFDCKTFFPCCCCSIISKNGSCYTECCCNGNSCKNNPNEPSILADLAAIPTALHVFFYTARAMKNFCSLSGIYSVYNIIPCFINDTIISWLWDKVF
ncbi:uncharacterized protein LOC134235418 [Saccostrea cucullata]|uniref:uncharacterized protein LOC134235418 n=1 Tax=Saccostrea cuccullata TaxID=36930 RepID=UPI002ED4EC05